MIIRHEARSAILSVLLCIAVASIGVAVATYPLYNPHAHGRIMQCGWLLVALAVLGLIDALPRLLGGVAVRLDESGFEVLYPAWRRRRVAWNMVRNFSTERTRGGYMIAECSLRTGQPTISSLQRGGDFERIVLPRDLTLSPDQIVALMNEWHARFGDASPHTGS